MKQKLAIVVILLSTKHAFSDENYKEYDFKTLLCVTEISTGFSYNNSKWVKSSFEEMRFIVKKSQLDYSIQGKAIKYPFEYEIKMLGSEKTEDFCKRNDVIFGVKDFLKVENERITHKGDILTCGYDFSKTIIDIRKSKFTKIYLHGYFNDEDRQDNTPYISFGNCVTIE